jgi:hypothetical protein
LFIFQFEVTSKSKHFAIKINYFALSFIFFVDYRNIFLYKICMVARLAGYLQGSTSMRFSYLPALQGGPFSPDLPQSLSVLYRWRRSLPQYRTTAMLLRWHCPVLWRRTGDRPWRLLYSQQRAAVGRRFRGQPTCRPVWLAMPAPSWALQLFGQRRRCCRQNGHQIGACSRPIRATPLIAPAPSGPFPTTMAA